MPGLTWPPAAPLGVDQNAAVGLDRIFQLGQVGPHAMISAAY